MLESLLTLFGTAASGGLFGMLGGLFKVGMDMWQAKEKAKVDLDTLKEKNAHELALRQADKEALILEVQHATELAQIGAAKEVDVAAYSALQSALNSDHASYATGEAAKNNPWFVAVDVLRGLIRPILTMFFSVCVAWLTYWVWMHIPDSLLKDPVFLAATFYKLVDALIFLATTSAGFWFGSRYTGKK